MLNQQYNRAVTPNQGQTKGYESVIGDGLSIKGGLTSENNIRIDGHIIGDINSQGSVLVGETGYVEGNILADEIIVAGNAVGNLHGTSVSLQEKAILSGDILCTGNNVSVSAGAEIEGTIKMNQTMPVTKPQYDRVPISKTKSPDGIVPDNTMFVDNPKPE